MAVERISMFTGGVLIGTQDFFGGALLLLLSTSIHFIEHEFHFRSMQCLTGEEVEEHQKP